MAESVLSPKTIRLTVLWSSKRIHLALCRQDDDSNDGVININVCLCKALLRAAVYWPRLSNENKMRDFFSLYHHDTAQVF